MAHLSIICPVPPAGARGKLPIDKNPTPSYLSPNHGWLRFASRVGVDLARKVPHFGALEAKSGRGGVIEGVG